MLNKKHISNVPMVDGKGAITEAWRGKRLAKFTASEWHYWMGEKPNTTGAVSYTYRKLGEELTGLPCRDEVDTVSTQHGKDYEPFAIKEFMRVKGLTWTIVQTLVCDPDPDSKFGCTPDVIIVHSESTDKQYYNVSVAEIKCPYSYDAYIALARCTTPGQVKTTNKIYYNQVLLQMDLCDALIGYLVIYHPFFKSGGLNIIEFRKKDLLPDFKLLNERKIIAVNFFKEVRNELELLDIKFQPA